MPLDPRVRRLLDTLAAGNPRSVLSQTVAERRSGLEQLMRLGGVPAPVAGVEQRSVPGPAGPLPARVYTPLGAGIEPMPGLVYLHGGGLVGGSLDTHEGIARALANAGACRVVALGYRLAPEHRFPAAVDDAVAAVTHIAEHAGEFGLDRRRLGICGDSAGATLAASACQAFAQAGVPRLAMQLLLCPILDHAESTASRREFARGFLVDQETLDHDLLHYLPAGTNPADPRVSPLRAGSLAGAPLTSIHTAEFDPLRDEGAAYAERLRLSGAEVRYYCHPGMIHLFYGLGGVIPYARTALEGIGAELRAGLS